MAKLFAELDIQALNNQTIYINTETNAYEIDIEYSLQLDGKLQEMSSGRLGQWCPCCDANKCDLHDGSKVMEGYQTTWNMDKLIESCYDLDWDIDPSDSKLKPVGCIAKHTKKPTNPTYEDRFGICRWPMCTFLDVVDVWPVLHLW